jgi:2-iminobutanoate/2-iminopropanoate deaminase
MADRYEIRAGEAPAPIGSHSQALVVGDFLYTAGLGPLDPRTGSVVGDDVAAATRFTARTSHRRSQFALQRDQT